jgi:hypothetical protein
MLKSIIKKRISFALAIILTAVMLLQLSPTALAGINGVGVSAPSSPKKRALGQGGSAERYTLGYLVRKALFSLGASFTDTP